MEQEKGKKMKNGNLQKARRSGKTICWTVCYVIFRLLFPTSLEKRRKNFSYWLQFFFRLCLRRERCQTIDQEDLSFHWISRSRIIFRHHYTLCIHVYEMSHNLTSLNVIDWQTNPNYAGGRQGGEVEKHWPQSIIHSNERQKNAKEELYTAPARRSPENGEKLLPFALSTKCVHDNIQAAAAATAEEEKIG